MMKKQCLLVLAFAISVFSFAQKKELKALEKAIQQKNFAEAKSMVPNLKQMVSAMDDKMKSKYYFNTAQAYYANGSGTNEDFDLALSYLEKVDGNIIKELPAIKDELQKKFLLLANSQYRSQEFKSSANGFDRLYRLFPQDTSYLYYSAFSSFYAQDYEKALSKYNKLVEYGYEGTGTEYYATNIETGAEEVHDRATRDLLIKSGNYIKPGSRKLESKTPIIKKNIALALSNSGKVEEALNAIEDAKISSPDDIDLMIAEANVYRELDEDEKYQAILKRAVEIQPNNTSLHYNIGANSLNANNYPTARVSFSKVLELDPTFIDAVLNLSMTYTEEGNELVEQMNALGNSSADNLKYDELKAQQKGLFEKGAEILATYVTNNPNEKNNGILERLINIYKALGEVDKAKAIEAKLSSGN